MNYTYEDKID